MGKGFRELCGKRLPEEEIFKLIEQAQAGDIEARNKVIVSNIGLARQEVFRYRWMISERFDLEDLFQEAVCGISRAIGSFKIKLGHAFSTYARFWITKYICEYITDNKTAIRLPRHVYRIQKKFYKLKGENPEWDDELCIEAVAKQMKIKVSMVESSLKAHVDVVDKSGFEEDYLSFLSSEEQEEEYPKLSILLNGLSEREKLILIKRADGISQKDIGSGLGISGERVRQIQDRAIKRIRDNHLTKEDQDGHNTRTMESRSSNETDYI